MTTEIFTPTLKIADHIWFDDNHKRFILPKTDQTIDYSDLLHVDFLEDDLLIKKSSLLSVKRYHVCKNLSLKITTKSHQILLIPLIATKTKKYTLPYNLALKTAQKILQKFQTLLPN